MTGGPTPSLRIRSTGGETKLFRDGDYPVLGGTALLLDDQTAYLWTTGYVPQLDTYIGPETPNPLHITVMRSKNATPDICTVLADIMGLTKINYTSASLRPPSCQRAPIPDMRCLLQFLFRLIRHHPSCRSRLSFPTLSRDAFPTML
jgi:hypothetical protein